VEEQCVESDRGRCKPELLIANVCVSIIHAQRKRRLTRTRSATATESERQLFWEPFDNGKRNHAPAAVNCVDWSDASAVERKIRFTEIAIAAQFERSFTVRGSSHPILTHRRERSVI
jgi:hypothetical protein